MKKTERNQRVERTGVATTYEAPRLVNFGDIVEKTLGPDTNGGTEKFSTWIEASW